MDSTVQGDARPRDRPLRPEPHMIAPRDEFEARCGKPTLLTDYHLDDLIEALARTSHDPDLMAKLKELRAAE